jgi:GAF domain-containing protein/anti-sigma regulatory factor (Ser/Thr protein kinase)
MGEDADRAWFGREPDAVPRARRFVSAALSNAGAEALTGDCELVASELVTNALLHGEPPVGVRVRVTGGRVRLEVGDGSRATPVRAVAGPETMTGRGLWLVATLADRWGIEAVPPGKVVWAELGGSGGVHTIDGEVDAEALLRAWHEAGVEEVGEPRHTLRLGDIPTDLLLAAKAHVDNLVREFALMSAGAVSGASGAVPAHLGQLIEKVTTRFAEARQAIKRQALAAAEAGDARTHLSLTLPLSAARAGEEYLAGLDEADAYARAARLLTLETPPHHRAFRRWYVTSMIEQLRRAASGEPPVVPPTFEQCLLDELGQLAEANKAAERSARLQAVTAALAPATTAEHVASVVVSEGVTALGAVGGSLLVPSADGLLEVPGALGYSEELIERLRAEHPGTDLPAAVALRTGESVWLESLHERDSRFPGLVGLEPATVALCAVPLTVGEQVIGVLRFSFDVPQLFDEDTRRFMTGLAAQATLALERARLFAAERAARARTAFLDAAAQLLTSTLEPQDTLDHLTALLVPSYGDWAVVYLVDEDGIVRPTALAHRDRSADELAELSERDVDLGHVDVVRQVVHTRVTSRHAPGGMVVPLVARGAVVGAVALGRRGDSPYSEQDRKMVEDVGARAAVAVTNARQFERERGTALMLQRSLLPQRMPRVPGITFAWRYLPAGEGTHVGGDWYDVIDLGAGRVALVIGDVMGRGLQAAAVMGQLRATARASASIDVSPAEVLVRLDRAVSGLEQSQITTALFAVLDIPAATMTVASAGHLPPLIVRPDGRADYLEVEPGPPLGSDMPDYPTTTVPLEPGSTLLLFTDGLVEDRARPVEVGMEALRVAAAGVANPEQLCERVLDALGRSQGHDDDTALLAVTLNGDVTASVAPMAAAAG